MTELNKINREIYLDLCKTTWSMDDKSMEYIKHRTSEEWEPVPELKALIDKGVSYEDQRIRFDIDMGSKKVQSLFEKDDNSYSMFRSRFRNVINYLSEHGYEVNYENFITNKIVYNKNSTKIKKVFEQIYKENPIILERDFGTSDVKRAPDLIVREFEKIGASKKSLKKLQFVISFNPMDWLLASTAENFSSCFNIANNNGGYQYCLGLPFLCGDKNRAMLYITNGAKKECLGIKVDSVQSRTWCNLDKNNNIAIVKWYPNDTIGVDPVNSIVGVNNFVSRDKFCDGKYPIDMLCTKKGACIGVYLDLGSWYYEDGKILHKGTEKGSQQWFTNSGIPLHEDRRHSTYKLRSDLASSFGIPSANGFCIPKWKKIGLNVDMMFQTASCTCCGTDAAGFFVENEREEYKFFCKDCYVERMFVCSCCGSTKVKDDSCKTVETTDGRNVLICEDCARNISRYTCSCCGKFDKRVVQTADGSKLCNYCIESGRSGYSQCDGCGKLTKTIVIKHNQFLRETERKCVDCNTTSNYSNYSTFGRHNRMLITNTARRGSIE